MFELTRQERQVALFLITVALLGAGIDFLAKNYPPVKTIVRLNQDMAKINLNIADKDSLISIPGIGEKLAKRIIEYRQKQASFASLEELKNIKGISESKYEKIKGYLTLE